MCQNSKERLLAFWKYIQRNKGVISAYSSLSIIFLTIIVISVRANNWADWTGLGSQDSVTTTIVTKQDSEGNTTESETKTSEQGKTLWDWLSLLGVPLSLAVLGYWLQQQQQERDRATSQKQQEIIDEQTSEEILQGYFDRLSTLLVGQNILAIATKDNPTPDEQELLATAVDIIRARTLSVLRRFKSDRTRKSSVTSFLIETEVIKKAKLSLKGADLSNINFRDTNLSDTDLSSADLSGADLSNADLSGADLSKTLLSKTKFVHANLSNAKLSGAQINNANFSGAQVDNTDLSGADLKSTNLSNTDLSGANLNGTNLYDIDLSGADLNSAYFFGSNLERIQLNETDLLNIVLQGARISDFDVSKLNSGIDLSKVDFISDVDLDEVFAEFSNSNPELFQMLEEIKDHLAELKNLSKDFEDCQVAAKWLNHQRSAWIEMATEETRRKYPGSSFPAHKRQHFKHDLQNYLDWTCILLNRGGSVPKNFSISNIVPSPTFTADIYITAINYLVESIDFAQITKKQALYLQEGLLRLRDQLQNSSKNLNKGSEISQSP